MATPPLLHRTTRVTLIGTYAGGAEEWSTGFWMGKENADADLPTQQLADDIRSAWYTFFTAPASQISNRWETTLVKVSSLGMDGKSDSQDTIYSAFAGNCKGVATTFFPPQIALAATMTSAVARGVGAKGRMFIPGVSMAVEYNGTILTGAINGLRDKFVDFLNACNTSTATADTVVLASHGSINKDGTPKVGGKAPITKAVTGVRVGNVYDTQRRRRNGISESYVTGTLASF
jgi:hypothetical protein